MKEKKDLTQLLIDLNETTRRLDRIKNDPQYIEDKVKEIWKDRPRRDYTAELETIVNMF